MRVANGVKTKNSQAWYYNETSEFDDDSNQASFVQQFFVKNSGPATIKRSTVTIKIPYIAQNGAQIIAKRTSAQEAHWRPKVVPENMKLPVGGMRGRRKPCECKNKEKVNKLKEAAENSGTEITTNEFKCGDGSAICIELECYIGEFKVTTYNFRRKY